MKKLKKQAKKPNLFLFLIFFSLAFLASLLIGYKLLLVSDEPRIKIKNITFSVEVVRTSEEKRRGLSNRNFLPEKQGMLFLYDKPDRYSFWMKEMLIPLDFIWINNSQIVELTENVQPEDYQPPKALSPEIESTSILEVNAGTVEKFNFQIGDRIEFFID